MPRHLALVGMSNIGKSHWAARLEREAGYRRIDCDDLIREQLDAMLPPGRSPTERLAAWMGTPADARYRSTSAEYVNLQDRVIADALDRTGTDDEPVVLDTPGSIVYSDPALLARIRKAMRVVYLEAPADAADIMFKRFQAVPKPLIWRDIKGVTHKERYFNLLKDRARTYRSLADSIVPYKAHSCPDASPALLLG